MAMRSHKPTMEVELTGKYGTFKIIFICIQVSTQSQAIFPWGRGIWRIVTTHMRSHLTCLETKFWCEWEISESSEIEFLQRLDTNLRVLFLRQDLCKSWQLLEVITCIFFTQLALYLKILFLSNICDSLEISNSLVFQQSY